MSHLTEIRIDDIAGFALDQICSDVTLQDRMKTISGISNFRFQKKTEKGKTSTKNNAIHALPETGYDTEGMKIAVFVTVLDGNKTRQAGDCHKHTWDIEVVGIMKDIEGVEIKILQFGAELLLALARTRFDQYKLSPNDVKMYPNLEFKDQNIRFSGVPKASNTATFILSAIADTEMHQ